MASLFYLYIFALLWNSPPHTIQRLPKWTQIFCKRKSKLRWRLRCHWSTSGWLKLTVHNNRRFYDGERVGVKPLQRCCVKAEGELLIDEWSNALHDGYKDQSIETFLDNSWVDSAGNAPGLHCLDQKAPVWKAHKGVSTQNHCRTHCSTHFRKLVCSKIHQLLLVILTLETNREHSLFFLFFVNLTHNASSLYCIHASFIQRKDKVDTIHSS